MQGVERLGQAISEREEAEDANVLGTEQGDLFPCISLGGFLQYKLTAWLKMRFRQYNYPMLGRLFLTKLAFLWGKL